MDELYTHLRAANFDAPFVRRHLLPDWWDDSMAANSTTRAIAEVHLARMLGLPLHSLRAPEADWGASVSRNLRLKRNKGVAIEALRPALILAQGMAANLVEIIQGLPEFVAVKDAERVRAEILAYREAVDLQGLLDWAWQHGVIVAHLHSLPTGARRFSGLALFCNKRPLIVLASRRDSPPWLAFHLAHELSHILLGDVQPGQPLVDADLSSHGPLEDQAAAAFAPDEARADAFAMSLLTAVPRVDFSPEYGLTGEKLAQRALSIQSQHHVDAGTLALIYGHSAERMGVAQRALRLLGLDHGAQQMIRAGVERHLPPDLPETTAAFLALMNGGG
jgi:hypothetical protein